jgi:hypothetical protein
VNPDNRGVRAWLLVLGSGLLYAAAVLWMAGQLPPTGVPVHFDGGGAADGFGTRDAAVGLAAGVGVTVVLLSAAALVLVMRGPAGLINAPYRAYWTAPERVARFRRMAAWDVAVVMSLALLLVLAVFPLGVVHAVRSGTGAVPWTPWSLVAFVVVVFGWVGYRARYHYRPDRDRAGTTR